MSLKRLYIYKITYTGGLALYDILPVIVNLRCERRDGEEYVAKTNFCLLSICIFVRD